MRIDATTTALALMVLTCVVQQRTPNVTATVRTDHGAFTACEQRMIQNVQLLDRVWAERVERHYRKPNARSDQPYVINFFTNCNGSAIRQLDSNCAYTRRAIEQLGLVWFARLRHRLPIVVRALETDATKRWRTVEYGVDVDFIDPGGKHEDAVGGYVCNFGQFTLAHSLNNLLHFNMAKRYTFDRRNDDGFYLPAVLAHEMGHVFGLGHSNEQGSVLTPQFNGVLRPSSLDYIGLERVFSNAVIAYDRLVATEREQKRNEIDHRSETDGSDAATTTSRPNATKNEQRDQSDERRNETSVAFQPSRTEQLLIERTAKIVFGRLVDRLVNAFQRETVQSDASERKKGNSKQ